MSRNSIYEKIEEKGRLEAEQILLEEQAKATAAADLIIQKANDSAENKLNNAKSKANDKIKTAKTSFDQLNKQKLLDVKKTKIHETFLKALAGLKEMNDEMLSQYVIGKLKKDSVSGVMKVNAADYSRYVSLFGENLEKINNELNLNLTLSNEAVLIEGGFIIENDYFDVDYSFESIIADLEEELEAKIAGILFNEGEKDE